MHSPESKELSADKRKMFCFLLNFWIFLGIIAYLKDGFTGKKAMDLKFSPFLKIAENKLMKIFEQFVFGR